MLNIRKFNPHNRRIFVHNKDNEKFDGNYDQLVIDFVCNVKLHECNLFQAVKYLLMRALSWNSCDVNLFYG